MVYTDSYVFESHFNHKCDSSLVGKAFPCHGKDREFESHLSLMNEIEKLKEENEDLRYEIFELKNKRNLDYEYNELINDILSSAIELKKIKEEDENEDLFDYCNRIIEYIRNFKDDYNLK